MNAPSALPLHSACIALSRFDSARISAFGNATRAIFSISG